MKTAEYAIKRAHAALGAGEWFWKLQAIPGVKSLDFNPSYPLFRNDESVTLQVTATSQRVLDKVYKKIHPYLFFAEAK
jgi:hypothetical protein